jgi:cytochrome c-type biogenesis protein CcmE
MKLAGIIGIFVVAVGLLLFQAKQTTTSTMRLPSELAALGSSGSLQRVRVAGRVSALPIEYQTAESTPSMQRSGVEVNETAARGEPAGTSGSEKQRYLRLSFTIQDPPPQGGGTAPLVEPARIGTVPVVYYGVRPDMFAPGRDVIIDGNLESGTLQATKLLTQCPSKYEPPDPVKQSLRPETAKP